MQQLLSECDPTIHSLSLCRLTFSRWSGCDGSAPGSSSASWCHTQRASSGRLPQANHEPPRSRGPSGSTHKAQGPGCSFPQPHLHTAWRTEFRYLTSKKLYKSGSLCSKHGLLRHCFMKKIWFKKGTTHCRAQWRLPPPSSSEQRRWTGHLMELSVSHVQHPYSVCWDRPPGLWYGNLLQSDFAGMAPLTPNKREKTLKMSKWATVWFRSK